MDAPSVDHHPRLLTDRNRLPEIFRLRAWCWEQSPGREVINTQRYPQGYRDDLEAESLHFIITDDLDRIIAAARLSVCHTWEELPYSEAFEAMHTRLPPNEPFVFYSRLVVHPDYRGQGLSGTLDHYRTLHQRTLGIRCGIVNVTAKRARQLAPFGFVCVARMKHGVDPVAKHSDHIVLLDLAQPAPVTEALPYRDPLSQGEVAFPA